MGKETLLNNTPFNNKGISNSVYQFLNERFDQVIQAVTTQKDEIIEESRLKYQELYQKNLEMEPWGVNIQNETEKQRMVREATQERKIKRNHAKKVQLRETVEENEFDMILDLVKQNNFVGARKKTAIMLMYLTGKG